MRLKQIAVVGFWLFPGLFVNAAGIDPLLESSMYRRPDLPVPSEEVFLSKGAKELWLRALERPEADMKCKAAHAIAIAHQDGFPNFETTIPALLTEFDRPDQHPTARLAVAKALVVLDARQAAASFFRQMSSSDSDLHEIMEPALAAWDHRPARAVWLSRLREPATPSRSLTLALRCLADVREKQAVEPLRTLMLSERVAGPIRLQAARALAALRDAGLEKDAERLSADRSRRGLVGRLAATSLLRQHRGAESLALLQRLARDAEPAVAAPAVARLLEIDPRLLEEWVDYLRDGRDAPGGDANLRLLAVAVLNRRPSAKHIHMLISRLDDEHAIVRIAARDHLGELARETKWRGQILQEAMGLLKSDRWRELEQAIILLTQLDHKPAAALLVKLLTFEREEVSISAAWALRHLAVAETLPGVVEHIEARAKPLLSGGPAGKGQAWARLVSDHQLSQLNQFLGQQKYRPGEAVLRRFVVRPPTPAVSAESRAAAFWALGLIHEGQAPDDLVKAAEGRLNDTTSIPPEDNRVRWMSAIALGRWKAKKAVSSLRAHYPNRQPSPSGVNNACGWALEQIAGEVVPAPQPIRKARHDWFLLPQGE